MFALILVTALQAATPAPPPKSGQREAAAGCTTPLQLAADAAQPPQPAPCPKPYLMASPAVPSVPPLPVAPIEQRGPDVWPRTERTPNLYHQPTRCGPVADEITRRIETSAPARRMGATYAVVRTVDGCGVPTPISYHPDYLLPGAADATAKPADAPGRRR